MTFRHRSESSASSSSCTSIREISSIGSSSSVGFKIDIRQVHCHRWQHVTCAPVHTLRESALRRNSEPAKARADGLFSLAPGKMAASGVCPSGWRRSADRAGLQANSLVSGNFTGNFAILVSQKPISLHETAVLQRLLVQFPTRLIRENNFKNKEFSKTYQGPTVQESRVH
jgi:hypothetical protein